MARSSTTWQPGYRPPGAGRPLGAKNLPNLEKLHDKALKVVESHLDKDSLSAATYVYDQNMGKAGSEQTITVNLPEMKTLLEILHGFPDALRAVQAKFLPEANDALPDVDPAA